MLRTPWDITSTGPGGGLYKSTDGGDTWNRLGLRPAGIALGKIGVTVSPVNPQRVWATVEADDKGGVYRSDDGGPTWQLLNGSFNMTSRHSTTAHFLPTRSTPTPSTPSARSPSTNPRMAARTTPKSRRPHSDYHDLWIEPKNPLRMVNGSDGGADGDVQRRARLELLIDNQPTAQFYAVTTDNLACRPA